MTSNSQEQHMLRVSQQSGKSSVFAVALGIALFGVFLSAPAQAATFMVNSPVDGADIVPGDGVCHTGEAVPTCTLRAAIIEANALPGADQIILPPNTYVLTLNTTLGITDHLTITGGGASATFIDGATRQVFFVGAGIFVNFSGITIRNGFANGAGGGINNFGTLTLISSTVSGNHAFDWGGGISNNNGGTLTLTNSTVSGNSASIVGGGIFNWGTLALTNSTVSGNTALQDGGGIYNHWQNFDQGTVILFNVTITDNRADANFTGHGIGGGVFNASGSTFNFQNTIIAGNVETRFNILLGLWVSTFRDCAGTLTSIGNNLMRNDDNCTVNGSAPTLANPVLGPLQNNGGPTQTHALLAGSPAIDGGNPAGCRDLFGALLTTDQRGLPRLVNRDRCDIGAFELQASTGLVSAVLPSSRSVQVKTPATVFATVINLGSTTATSCGITLLTNIPVIGFFQTTNPLTNQLTGTPNTPVDIPAGAAQSFVIAFTPTQAFAPTDAQMIFDCTNTDPAPIHTGLNTLLLSASATAVPDIVALAATTTNDGIVNIPNGTGAFAVATGASQHRRIRGAHRCRWGLIYVRPTPPLASASQRSVLVSRRRSMPTPHRPSRSSCRATAMCRLIRPGIASLYGSETSPE